MTSLLPVWIALGAIALYEILALFTPLVTWSVLISNALKGHPKKAIAIFAVVVLIAGHVIFGWFNRHHAQPPSGECLQECY